MQPDSQSLTKRQIPSGSERFSNDDTILWVGPGGEGGGGRGRGECEERKAGHLISAGSGVS